VYWKECEGIVMVGVMSSCWRGLVLLFVQSLCNDDNGGVVWVSLLCNFAPL
jgi:hypothetical protein